METSIFEQWDRATDLKGLQADIDEAAKDSKENRTYEEVPHGKYEISIEKMELKATKANKPMVSVWMRILSGKYANQLIFMNQVIQQGFQIHIVNQFLRDLLKKTANQSDVVFESYEQYGQLLLDIHEAIDGHFEYAVDYGATAKGFNTFAITEVFELED